ARRRQQPHVLPAARYLGDARSDGKGVRGHVRKLALLDGARERELFDRRVAEWHVVTALQAVARDLRRLHLETEAVTVLIDAPVLETERAARPGVGRVARPEGVVVAPAWVGVDVDRHDACRAIGLGWQHLEVGEVLRVIERELGAQYLGEVEGVALVVAQV